MFRVIYSAKTLKQLKRIDRRDAGQIVEKIGELSTNPYALSYKKAKGANCYILRVGDYRVIYDVRFEEREVRVLLVGRRDKVYDEL
ncbi:MAG: type II toxin-antitoxin system RelE/ParE family toxin [Nitrososphaerales archaeon]